MTDEFEFEPLLSKLNPSSHLVVFELTYHLSIAFAQSQFYRKFLAKYGTCIMKEIPKVNYLDQEHVEIKLIIF